MLACASLINSNRQQQLLSIDEAGTQRLLR
jgi:hypothetical protein